MTDTKADSFEDIPFTDTEIPTTDSAPSGISCTVCGKDIGYLYAGKGRKPKYCEEHKPSRSASNLGSGPRGSADVKAAVNTLSMMYTALQTVLVMTGATEAATAMRDSIPGLQEQNAAYLSQDKDLVKRINSLGKTGGRYAFFAAQAMVLGPVAVIATREYRDRFGGPIENDDAGDVPATVGGFPVE